MTFSRLPIPDQHLSPLLRETLQEHGVEVRPDGVIAVGERREVVSRIWAAFQQFAADTVEHLHAASGLKVPDPGRSDLDRLGFEAHLVHRPAKRSLPERPPSAWLWRELYLVTDDEERSHEGSDVAALRFELSPALPTYEPSRVAVFGAGGPQSRQTGQEPGLPQWFHAVEATSAWAEVIGPHLERVTVE